MMQNLSPQQAQALWDAGGRPAYQAFLNQIEPGNQDLNLRTKASAYAGHGFIC